MQRLSHVIRVHLSCPPHPRGRNSAECPRGSWESFTLNSTIRIPFNSKSPSLHWLECFCSFFFFFPKSSELLAPECQKMREQNASDRYSWGLSRGPFSQMKTEYMLLSLSAMTWISRNTMPTSVSLSGTRLGRGRGSRR